MAIVVEDTEGFDARVLGDLLLALSDAADTLPVCVLLGVATSANMVHALLPAATAARLDARAFKLYAPKDVMAAVTARVLMDPARAPALSNAALELLATRFKEHDFSLSAARRAVHLLTLEHFMYQPLAAAAPAATAAAAAAAAAERAERDAHAQTSDPDYPNPPELFCLEDVARDVARDDAAVNAADPARDAAAVSALAARSARVAATAAAAAAAAADSAADAWLTPKSVQWAKKHLGLGTKEEVARALRDAFPARKRWGLAVRCVAAGAAASGARKGELSALFVDASAAKWMTEKNANASQGESLLRLICARLERDDTDISVIRAACRRWARLVALEPAMHAEYGEDLRAAAALCDRAEAEARRGDFLQTNFLQTTESAPAAEAAAGAKNGEGASRNEAPAASPPAAAPAAVVSPASARARRRAGPSAATPTAPRPSAREGEDAAAAPETLTSPDGARAVAAALVARRRAGPERARALELAAAARGKRRRGEDRGKDEDCDFLDGTAAEPNANDARETRATESSADDGANDGDANDVTRTTTRRTSREGPSDARRAIGGDAKPLEATGPKQTSAASTASTAARRAACAFLRAVARAHASRPPCSLPGSALFCVTSTSRLREAVQAAPRLALEQQMANPQPFLRCGCCPPSGGASASLPDCCAAYTLLQDAGDAANVHEWFRAFCEMHASGSGGPEARAKATAKARGAGNAMGRGGRAEADERGGNARASDGASDAAPETNGLSNAEDEEETKNGKETFSLEKRRLWELQARFTRAAAELEFLGVARPVKRRKVEYMQRTAFPLDQLLGEDGL